MNGRSKQFEALARGIQRCQKCFLHVHREHAVPGEGPANARVMLVGEAPGEEEDKTGRPFVGRTGRFLNQVLEQCGLDRDRLFITSAVKCRPPKNRDPRDTELAVCKRNWLDEQMRLLDPELVVILGKVAMKQLLERDGTLAAARQGVTNVLGRKVLITYHPTAAMRFPELRKAFVADMISIKRFLEDRQ